MSIDDIRNVNITEDAKMDIIADYLENSDVAPTLDKVLENGNTAVGKTAKLQNAERAENFATINDGGFSGQETGDAGVAVARVASSGEIYIDFQHENGNALSTFQISLQNGVPRVVMSDDVKAAFKAELGIS